MGEEAISFFHAQDKDPFQLKQILFTYFIQHAYILLCYFKIFFFLTHKFKQLPIETGEGANRALSQIEGAIRRLADAVSQTEPTMALRTPSQHNHYACIDIYN